MKKKIVIAIAILFITTWLSFKSSPKHPSENNDPSIHITHRPPSAQPQKYYSNKRAITEHYFEQ